METHLEEIKLQNLSEFYRESLSTLSSLTETNFDVKDLLPKKKRISAKQEKEQMELMPSSLKRRMEPPFELAQTSYDWPHIEATDTDVSKHPELKRIFSQQHGAEEQAPKKKAALKKNERKLLSQSLTGLVSEKLLESEKSGSERKSVTRSRRSAEKLVDTSIVARPELMLEKSELGKKPITESLMPASTEKLVDTSIVAEPELVPKKSESEKKPIARARRSTEKLDASTSEDPIEPTQHAASQSIVASKKKPATKKSDEKAPALTEVELLPEKSDRAKPVIRIRRSTEMSDTGESIDRLQVSITEPVMEKSSPKKPKENFSLSQPGTKLEKSTKPIVGSRRSIGMSSSASPATSEISLASTRQPRNKSKSVFELLSPAIVGKRKSSTASKPPSVPPPRAGAETSLSSTSIAPLNIPDYMENHTPVPSIYDSDARQDKLTGLSAFMRHRRDSESSVDLSEHVSGVSSAVQYPRMTVTPGSVGNRVRTVGEEEQPTSALSSTSRLTFTNDIFPAMEATDREISDTPKPTEDKAVVTPVTPKPTVDRAVSSASQNTTKQNTKRARLESEDSIIIEKVEQAPSRVDSTRSDESVFKSPEGLKKSKLRLNIRGMMRKKEQPKLATIKKKIQRAKQTIEIRAKLSDTSSILPTSPNTSTTETSTTESPTSNKRPSLVGQPPMRNIGKPPVLPLKKKEQKIEIDKMATLTKTLSPIRQIATPAPTIPSPVKRATIEEPVLESRSELELAKEIRATSVTPQKTPIFDDDEQKLIEQPDDAHETSRISRVSEADSTYSIISIPEKVTLSIVATESETRQIETITIQQDQEKEETSLNPSTTTPKSTKKLTPLLLPSRSMTRERKPLRTSDYIYQEPRKASITSTPLKTPITAPASIRRLSDTIGLKSHITKRERKPPPSKEYPGHEEKAKEINISEEDENLSKAKEILRKDDQSALTPVKAKKEISPKKSAEKIKMQKEDGEKAMEEKLDLEKEMPDVIVAVPPFIEECETPIVEEPVEYIETEQAGISQKKPTKKVTTFEVKKKKTEQRHVFSQSAKSIEPMTTRSMSFKSDGRRRSFAVSQSELRPRSSTLSTISPLPDRMQKFHDEFTSALSHSLIHGREPRNKSKPVLELAPSLIKQEKRKLSADTLGPAKRRRTTIADASDILTPPTEPLQISIPSASVPDISATLKEATETLLKSLPPRPELPPIPQIPVFPDVSAAAASTTTPNIRDRAGRSSKQPKHRVFKHHPSQPTTPAQSEISEAQFDFPQKPQQDRYPAYGLVETQPNLIEMSIFDRLAKRKINPLAMGVVPRKEKDYEKEFFYREIFMRNPKHDDEPNEPPPDEIDVVEEEESFTDEVLQTNPADACANDIVAILPRISKVPTEDDSDSDSMEYTIDELKELAQYEPQIVSNHLLVLLKWIANQRLTDISTLNVTGGCSMFHSLTLRNANRTREALKLYSNKLMDSIVVAHDWLLPRLATPLLASYLNLLRFLHVAGSGVTKHVTNHDEKRDEKINEANKIIREFSLTKVQDPLGKSIKDNLDRLEKRVNASVLFVSPKITTPNYNPKIRAHETISQMLPTCTKMFESLKLEFVDVQGPINVENLTHMCIKLIKKKVKELVKRRPNDHIFLAGWGTTCLLNHAAVQEVKGVSGLLDFAFPSQTVYGPRGDVEDEILLTYCPTLFIVGEHASDCSLKDLQKLRENMTQENGLIVVGGANSNLYVNALRLSMERVSQRCVARTILEHVVDFMQEVITVAPPPVYSHQALKPIAVVNPFDVETSSLKPSRSEKSSTSATGGESSKIKGTASQSAASQAIIQARKEKLKKNQDALLQEKLRTLAADAVQPKKSVVSKMRTIAMKPEEIKRSLSQTPLTSPFSQKPQIKQHLQQNLQNPKKQKEFTQIFGEPINLTPARIDFGNKLRQATSSTSAPPHQVYSQQVQPSTSSQPQNRDREETLREEAAAVAALSTQSFITSFPDEPVENMDYDEYGKLL
uniref:KANSL3 helical domain-containing protein n=1 Tax=Acrobeloides nanus TaxID=290746 RepID=A0A914D262_9BILA